MSKPSEHISIEAVERKRARRWYFLSSILFAGALVTLIIASSVLEQVRQNKLTELQSRAADLVSRVETEFNVQLASLRAFRAFMEIHFRIDAIEFATYARNMRTTEIGTIAYGWAPKTVDTTVAQRNGSTTAPENPLIRTAFRVAMLEPAERLYELMGRDLLGLEQIGESLRNSVDFAEIRVTDPVATDITGTAKPYALAIYPHYRQKVPNFLIRQRRENVEGVVFGVVDIESVIDYAVRSSSFAELVENGYLGIEVVKEHQDQPDVLFYRTSDFERLNAMPHSGFLDKSIVSERELHIAQHRVNIRFVLDVTGLGNAPYMSALLTLAIGFLVTLSVAAYARSRFDYDAHVTALVIERTKALEESEARLRDMADVSADWFWETDSELRFTSLSERFEQVTGLSRKMFLGRTREEAVGVGDAENDKSWQEHLARLRARKPFTDFRYTVPKGGSKEEFISVSGKPFFDDDGNFVGYRGTGRDVTAEEEAQQRLRASEARLHRNVEQLEMSRQDLEESTRQMGELAERYAIEKDRAEASERSKSEFLASMSHEIRTPMTGVMGFADMLLDSNLAPEDREKVIKIKGATQSLLTIINDILDLSKLDAGRLNIEYLDFNLKATVDEVLDLVRERARVKKLSLNVEFTEDVAEGMHGDPTRFRQILINLVGNAVKFTHTGGVTIKAAMTDKGGEPFVEFRVVDTGIGIAEENRVKLFSDFSQADASISRHYEGTGLGLSISRRLVELMGGKIWVESEEGVGSTFCFTLPFRAATTDVTNVSRHHLAEHFKTLRPLHILVAEDNRLNQRIIDATLEKFGHTSTIVENGEDAVRALDNGEYDLVLMDIRMPQMSGPEATRAIRARSDKLAKIPIIALTADAMEEHIRGYLEAGMDACVTKPIDRSALVTAINDVLGEDIHVPLSEAEVARSGYAMPTDDTSPAAEQREVINVADFLTKLEDVANEIEREKRAKT